ncbi:putative sucrose-specific phosphotransferase system (PTS), IIABC component [Streptococcus pneumoniae]|nr:putative sucrose-specific phosphotransferase system (PTS), IIABC component [Streptococcus pneumoniae]
MNNQEIAKKVIDALGGRENVNSVAHCATRLRVMVKDEEKINIEYFFCKTLDIFLKHDKIIVVRANKIAFKQEQNVI